MPCDSEGSRVNRIIANCPPGKGEKGLKKELIEFLWGVRMRMQLVDLSEK